MHRHGLNDARRAQQSSPDYWRAAASELRSIALSSDELDASRRSWGAMPLIKLDAEWWAMHEEASELSTRGEHRLVPASSHFIPRDDPDLVVAAIEANPRPALSLPLSSRRAPSYSAPES